MVFTISELLKRADCMNKQRKYHKIIYFIDKQIRGINNKNVCFIIGLYQMIGVKYAFK